MIAARSLGIVLGCKHVKLMVQALKEAVSALLSVHALRCCPPQLQAGCSPRREEDCSFQLRRMTIQKNTGASSPTCGRVDVRCTLIGMEQLPRLVSGNCPNCSSTEIIVKMVHPDGSNYEGYCPGCGIDIVGTLISGTTKAVVLK